MGVMVTTPAKNLLVELLVEELPPKALKQLGEAFAEGIQKGLTRRRLLTGVENANWFASPRRLAVWIPGVSAVGANSKLSEKLMPATVAFGPDGKPSPALFKRLKKLLGEEVDVERALASGDFVRKPEGSQEYLFREAMVPGEPLALALGATLDETLRGLPIPKLMQYQLDDGWTTVGFVRPAHRLVALHGEEIVAVRVLGLAAGRETQGHRFEAAFDPVVLKDADSYAFQLREEGAVIASFADRRAEIRRQLDTLAVLENAKPVTDDALLDEVTALVERPNVLVCTFEKEYLQVPPECLILTMKANQKYFPLLDAENRLTNKFLVVSNISPADPSRVVEGNERVVRPRLADAKFFFDQDRKRSLESRVEGLKKVVYHNKLGTQYERSKRVQAVAGAIGRDLGGEGLVSKAERAALLAKADLLTDMVGEFPELQGIMGRYYAMHDGESEETALAVEDHYRPRFAGDSLPRNQVGLVVALADKLETLAGMFGIGEVPSGDKDPFALRRNALGVIRLVIENDLDVDIAELVGVAARQHSNEEARISEIAESVVNFIWARLEFNLREQGVPARQIDAVFACAEKPLREIPKRLDAVRAFSALPEAGSLASANKRVQNILGKSGRASGFEEVSESRLVEPAERQLFAELRMVASRSDALFESGDYAQSLLALAVLKTPVDAFFDTVMVNVDDPALRNNRLALLTKLHSAMNRVAHLDKLAS